MLLSKQCGLSCPSLATLHPSLHYSVVLLLTQHTATHHYFLSSSSLLSSLPTASPTATHFAATLALLTHLQQWGAASYQVSPACVFNCPV